MPGAAGKPGGVLQLLDTAVISGKIAKTVLEEMYATGQGAKAIVEARGLVQVSDHGAIEAIVDEVIRENPVEVNPSGPAKRRYSAFWWGR